MNKGLSPHRGGAGGSFNKQKFETLDKANLSKEQSKQDSKILKYFLEFVLGLCAIEGTHEGLSCSFGNKGQVYEKPAQYSFVGMYRSGNDGKINNKINGKCNTDKTEIDTMTKKLISDFRVCASYAMYAGKIVKELEKVFDEQEVKKLQEISHVDKKKMFGYDYEEN